MLPVPARIAATPSATSRPSWNPAVPPPPVTGAPVRIGLDDGLCDPLDVWLAGWLALEVWVAGVPVAEVLVLVAEVLVPVEMPGVVTGVVLPGVDVLPALAEPLPEALVDVPPMKEENDGVGDPDDVQAETAAVPSMVRAPKPAAVSLALSAVLPMAVRTFIEPPHAPFPRPDDQKPGPERKRAAGPTVCPRQPRTAAGDHNAKAHGRGKHAMARPPFEY